MYSQSIYRQLILLDGTNNSIQLLTNIRDLFTIPSNCDVCIFCNQTDKTVQNSLNDLNNSVSHIRINESSNPIKQLFNVLNESILKYSLILIIGEEETIRTYKWNNTKEVQLNTYIVKMDSSSTTLQCVFNELKFERNETQQTFTSIDSQFFPQHQCPLCSKAFKSNDVLRKHYTDNHFSITDNNVDQDYEAKILFDKRSNPNDRYKPELYCLVCNQGLQSLEARENHIKKIHSNVL